MLHSILPLGSIVQLHGVNKRLMVCGRVLTRSGEDKIYDYCACSYPEGIVSSKGMYFFNSEDIEQVIFIGYRDVEEQKFADMILSLGELEVVDGKITKKDQ